MNTCADTAILRGEVYPSPEVKFVLHASTPNKTQCFKGNSFKFENKTTIKTGTVKYKWDFGDGSSSTSFNPPNKTYSKDGKYTVSLTATSDINCSETVSFEIIVLPSPKADFSTNAICSTSYSIVFKDASVLTNGKINSHIWDFGDGNGSKTNNPTHTYSYSGSYLVSLIVESDQGCKDTVKKSISAYDKILAKFDVNRNTCGVSSKIKFTNQSLAPLSSAFSWNFGDSTQSSQTSPEHQYNRADTFLVTLSVISPDGCISKAKESIQVYSNPEASFDIISLICDNSASANFTNKSIINPKDTIYYQWQFGDGNTSVVKSPSYTYGSYGSYKVNLKATSSKGCVDSMIKTISVRPMPKVDFEISDLDHCLNSNFVLVKDQTTLNSGTYKYNWSMGDKTTISNKSTVKHTYKTDTAFEITLKVVSDFGCSDSLTKSIEIYANPVAKIGIDSAYQCLTGNNFELVDSSVVKSSGFIAKQYWDFGDGTNDSTSGSKIYKTYGSYGSFNVTLRVVSQRGCSDIVKKPIRIYDMPNADFTVNSFKQCLSENEFRFNNQSTITAGNGALNYEWDLGNGQNSTNISPTEVYANHGTYNVTLLVSSVYGCTNSIIKPIEVYQNPDKPNIAVDRIIPCYGMLGSLRATVTGGVTPYLYSWNYGNATLNNGIDSLPAGVYRLDITDGNGCKSYDTFNLTQPDILEAKVVKLNDALCYGFANAKAKLDSIRGGVAPYYTEWYLGNKLVKVGELLSGVKSDYYKVLMRDFNGCGFLDSIYLSQPNKLEGQISILSPIKCYDSLGSVGITVKGGIKNPNRYLGYDFYWNGSRSPGTNQLLGVQAGLQKVMVYDSNGCALALSIELKEPSKLIGTLDSIIDVRCFGESNGRLHASAKGGLLNYRYLWTDTFNNFIAEGQKLDGLKAGYYKLVVKDRNGCVDSVKQIYEVLQPDPITVDLLERMNITCFNGSNGKMRVGAKGGNGGYEYEWMTVPISTKDSFIENLSSGRYVLKVNDSRGCALETIFTLANPLRNPVLIQNDSVEVCKNDTLYLRANMNQSIAYQWIFNGQNMKYSQDSFLLIPNVQNGSAGIYTVIGTDQLGCQDTAKLEVFMNELPTVNLKLNPVIACLGSDCEMEATGANKYTWYKERYTPVYGRDTLLGNGSIYKFTGVKQTDVGKYFVMGESIQGCKNEDFVYLKVGLDSIVVPNDTQVCAGSTFALRAKGGVSYEWVAPNGKLVNSPSYIVSPVSRSDSGIYTLNVVDRWNCSGKYKVNVMVNPRPKISVFDALLGDHCEGTDVELIANTDAAKMSWMGPDFTQINTTKNVQSIKNVSIKDQGYYKVVAYSVFGCMDSATTFVKVNPIPLADFAYTHNCPPNPLANEAVNFFTTSLKASKYEFYIDNVLVSKDQGFTHKFTVPGSYVVKMKAMNEYLCFKEITQSIVVEEPVKLNVPNAFTPNNDRLNSEFKPVNVNVPNYKMLIYDRWGSKMYEEMNGAWDGTCLGKPVPIGVYVVIVEYSTICSDDKLILDKRSVSDVTLMR